MRFGVSVAAFACSLVVGLVLAAAASAQPNFVIILTDDQQWTTTRYMPTVQRELIGHGIRFKNGFVTNPLCCPSRASLLTGAYSHTTGVYSNGGPHGGFPHFDDRSTIATWLDDAGYETGFFGKYLNMYPGSYVPPGWDRWVGFTWSGYYSYGYDIDGHDFPSGPQPKYSTDFLADQAVSFLHTATKPFFLYFSPFAPHKPATPADRHATAFPDLKPWRPPSYNERDVSDKPPWIRDKKPLSAKKRRYLDNFRSDQIRTLLAVDDAVSDIVEELRHSGDLENTVIVFMSDNGFLWGEHRVSAKWYPYEESIRVPFVVRADSLIGRPHAETRAALGIDVAPTFADLAGVPAPGADGRSLVPLLTDSTTRWRRTFLVEGLAHKTPPYCAIRTNSKKFVMYSTGDSELYNLTSDPHELLNRSRARSQRGTVDRLRTKLARLCNPPPPGVSRRLLCTHEGTRHADDIVGSGLYDIVCAGRGRDRIDPRGSADYVYAGLDNDYVYARDGRVDFISCGKGRDVAEADTTDRVFSNCEVVRRA